MYYALKFVYSFFVLLLMIVLYSLIELCCNYKFTYFFWILPLTWFFYYFNKTINSVNSSPKFNHVFENNNNIFLVIISNPTTVTEGFVTCVTINYFGRTPPLPDSGIRISISTFSKMVYNFNVFFVVC